MKKERVTNREILEELLGWEFVTILDDAKEKINDLPEYPSRKKYGE